MASKATKSPAVCWMTRAGSPLAGSVKLADPPTGTPDAGPTAVPFGSAAVVGVAPVPDVVDEPADRSGWRLRAGERVPIPGRWWRPRR